MRVSGFRFADESKLPSCALLICREVETVIHVNGHVKDIYTQKSTFFYMLFTVVIMHLITRAMLLFFYNMVLVHTAAALLIMINCYFQYTILQVKYNYTDDVYSNGCLFQGLIHDILCFVKDKNEWALNLQTQTVVKLYKTSFHFN